MSYQKRGSLIAGVNLRFKLPKLKKKLKKEVASRSKSGWKNELVQ